MRARSSMAIVCCLGTLLGIYSVQVFVDLLLGIGRHIKYDVGMVVSAIMLSLIFQVCSGVSLFGSLVAAKAIRLEKNRISCYRKTIRGSECAWPWTSDVLANTHSLRLLGVPNLPAPNKAPPRSEDSYRVA
jgi:hypothetical protein